MRLLGDNQLPFPEQGNVEECNAWRPIVRRRAIASRVLVVARTRIEGAWAAYVDAVPGANHELEFEEVLRSGCKMLEHEARVFFPSFAGIPYAE